MELVAMVMGCVIHDAYNRSSQRQKYTGVCGGGVQLCIIRISRVFSLRSHAIQLLYK